MKRISVLVGLAIAMAPLATQAQGNPQIGRDVPIRSTFLRLTNNSNAVLSEPVTPDPVRSRIVIINTHPEHLNNFSNSPLTAYGYRTMGVNYYGPEITYEEFLLPLAAAVKAARAIPGVEKVVLFGHSTGGPVLTFYQDVAENGPKACQEPARTLKCDSKGIENLPRADGIVAFDANSGAPDRIMAFDPAVDPHDWTKKPNEDLDSFSPKNGYDPRILAFEGRCSFVLQRLPNCCFKVLRFIYLDFV